MASTSPPSSKLSRGLSLRGLFKRRSRIVQPLVAVQETTLPAQKSVTTTENEAPGQQQPKVISGNNESNEEIPVKTRASRVDSKFDDYEDVEPIARKTESPVVATETTAPKVEGEHHTAEAASTTVPIPAVEPSEITTPDEVKAKPAPETAEQHAEQTQQGQIKADGPLKPPSSDTQVSTEYEVGVKDVLDVPSQPAIPKRSSLRAKPDSPAINTEVATDAPKITKRNSILSRIGTIRKRRGSTKNLMIVPLSEEVPSPIKEQVLNEKKKRASYSPRLTSGPLKSPAATTGISRRYSLYVPPSKSEKTEGEAITGSGLGQDVYF
ncbi:hypothetical protein BP6252_02105 [Coleophoma cylindrospora]|uniref:Uncharacterized protein n=1 Tax=Coleophoma cylindrospora TaxID=1849047 RepID=A0A3D8SDV3_9HELO|nr:hypothetical protein BP6252_02105 [Coleophoma cylindrospora]